MAKRSFYVKDSELDDYQVMFINKNTDKSLIVKGCAGSGKSILALWKAKQIQDEHKGSYLYVVYTKTLRQYVDDAVKQIGLSQQNVVTFDSCFSWSRDEKGNFIRNEWKKGKYDYIFLDEAQDFSEDDILILKSKALKAFHVYGDTAQQLFSFLKDRGKKTVSIEEIAVSTKFPIEPLVFNHRLTKKIARVAQYFNSENDDLVNRCVNEGTEKPKILEYDSLVAQYDAIISLIKDKSMEDVGILFRKGSEVENAYNYFKSKGMNVEAKFGKMMNLDFNSSNPKMMTYHGSKGLQFEHVFIPNCIVAGNDERNPLYVAMTRSYEVLYIMYSGNLSTLFDSVSKELYDTSLSPVSKGPKLTL